MEVAIVKYNAGNIYSVVNALRRLGVEPIVTDQPERLRAADRVLFPGQGEASQAMSYLRAHGLDSVISSLRQPVLGICIGQQLMCRHSEEGDTDCLGIFPVDVLRFRPERHEQKVPHMGWNEVRTRDNGKWTMDNGQWPMDNGQRSMDNGQRSMDNGQWSMDNGQRSMVNVQSSMDKVQRSKFKVQSSMDNGGLIEDRSFVYFVHSYYVPVCEFTTAVCDYIVPFSAALRRDNFFATQFHPEKSGAVGEQILRRFLETT
jgi:glutamine amidotransferase